VLVGEFGAIKRTNPVDLSLHIAGREYFNKYVVSSAISKGLVPVYWDNGASDFGLFNRHTAAVVDQGVINAIMQGAGISTTTYITLTNRATGLLIDGMGRTTNGSNCGQWSNSGSYNQQWVLETAGSYVKLKNRATGLYLDGMGRTSNGSIAGLWATSSSDNQQWTKETVGGYIKFKNRASGLYLDGLGSTTNGADLGQWSTSSSNNQQWSLTTVGSARVSTVQDTLSATPVNNPITSRLLLYPNPFKSTFNIVTDKPVERVVIFDLMGKQVKMIAHPSASGLRSIGTSLKSGMYLVEVHGADWTKSFKVIKLN
jgi:hypothetical protein